MKALTVCQPYAWALIHGPKGIENRTWPTRYRGSLLIHAGLSRKWLGRVEPGELPGCPPPDELVYGAFIGAVTLYDCLPYERVQNEPFTEGPWCWMLGHPVAFDPPVPYRGQRGLFDVPLTVLDKCNFVPFVPSVVNPLPRRPRSTRSKEAV